MANTRIQIKRSATNSTIPALYTGELAYSQNGTGTSATSSGLLYIGRPSDNVATVIGGVYNFGTLTANQAIVTNSTSGTDKLITSNVSTVVIWANGAQGTGGQSLFSNSTGGIYWATPGGGGTVTQINSANGIGLQPSPITTQGNVYVVAGVGIVVNSSGVNVNTAVTSGLGFTTGGLNVVAGPGVVVNSTGVCANIGPGFVFQNGTFFDPAVAQWAYGGL
jgi:hypothetical protein